MRKLALLCSVILSLSILSSKADLWSNASGDATGWKHLAWFGNFWSPGVGPGWFYHEELGWMYTPSETTESLFLYIPGPEWAWTSDTAFPWIYYQSGWPISEYWQLYLVGSSNPTIFYNQTTGAWAAGPLEFFANPVYENMGFETLDLATIGALELQEGSSEYALEREYLVYGGATGVEVPGESPRKGYLVASITTEMASQISFRIQVPEILLGKEVEVIIHGINGESDTNFYSTEVDGKLTLEPYLSGANVGELPALATFNASEPSVVMDYYSGGFYGRGLFEFSIALRYKPEGGDPVVYAVQSGEFSSVSLAVNQTEPTPTPSGTLISDMGFRPNPDGFGFQNFGGFSDTLDARDVYMLMGADYAFNDNGVYRFTPKGCVWAINTEADMEGGHCFGMSITATRFYFRLPLNGKIAPRDYQPGADVPLQLQFSYVENLVSFWMATQFNDRVNNAIEPNFEKSFADQIAELKTLFDSGTPVANLLMMENNGGGGHAITPYAITDEGEGVFRIWVYDNNFPSYVGNNIYVDTTAGTWDYQSLDPVETWYDGDFSGTEADENLGFSTIQEIEDNIAHFPLTDTGDTPPPVPTGMILTPQANGTALAYKGDDEIGYDFLTERFVKDWPGAELKPVFDHKLSPRIELPEPLIDMPSSLNAAYEDSVTIILGPVDDDSQDNSDTFDTGLGIEGSVYYCMLDEVEMKLGDTVTLSMHPSGQFFGIELSTDESLMPTLFIAVQDADTRAGVVYSVTPTSTMSSGDSLYLTLDPESEELKAYRRDRGSFTEISSADLTILMEECPPYTGE